MRDVYLGKYQRREKTFTSLQHHHHPLPSTPPHKSMYIQNPQDHLPIPFPPDATVIYKAGTAFLTKSSKYAWFHCPASGAGVNASGIPQKESYLVALESLVPSLSPPGLTHTNASTSELPVVPVGRTPNPAPLTLHQWPHSWRRPVTPLRLVSIMAWEGMPADLSCGEKRATYSFSFWALFHCASVAFENSPGDRS
jgi:hypothetical protein